MENNKIKMPPPPPGLAQKNTAVPPAEADEKSMSVNNNVGSNEVPAGESTATEGVKSEVSVAAEKSTVDSHQQTEVKKVKEMSKKQKYEKVKHKSVGGWRTALYWIGFVGCFAAIILFIALIML